MPAFLRMFTSDETVIGLGMRVLQHRLLLFTVIIVLGLCFEKIFQAVGTHDA